MPTWPACAPDCVAQASTARLLCFMPPLLNTARLMDDNPTLLRLKELETLEKVAENLLQANARDLARGGWNVFRLGDEPQDGKVVRPLLRAPRAAGFDGFERGDFEQDFFGRGVAQAQFGVGQNFQNARE